LIPLLERGELRDGWRRHNPYGKSSMAREEFTFFWQGPFSQWHHSRFTVSGQRFFCAEQFMMYCKAVLACFECE
jgi:predicted NAD-dependent protein-ADP-ribosyltransferase YbiA (DUF1768 family)